MFQSLFPMYSFPLIGVGEDQLADGVVYAKNLSPVVASMMKMWRWLVTTYILLSA